MNEEAWQKVLDATEGHALERVAVRIAEEGSWTYVTCECGESGEAWEYTDHIRRLVFDALRERSGE